MGSVEALDHTKLITGVDPQPDIGSAYPGKGGTKSKPDLNNIFFVPLEDLDILDAEDEIADRLLAETKGFHPLFIHQCFEGEVIPDWSLDLAVIIFYHKTTMHYFVRIYGTLLPNCRLSIKDAKDSIIEKLTVNIGRVPSVADGSVHTVYQYSVLLRDLNVFKDAVAERIAMPIDGTLVKTSRTADGKIIEIYKQDFCDGHDIKEPAKFPTMTEDLRSGTSLEGTHRRLEFLMHFFIESCSSIVNDSSWGVYSAYICDPAKLHPVKLKEIESHLDEHERSFDEDAPKRFRVEAPRRGRISSSDRTKISKEPEVLHHEGYEMAVFVTLFTYFKISRGPKRISQFFTLPGFQGRGLASIVLEHVYTAVCDDDKVSEIGVEDPAMAFSQIRDVVGLKLCFERKYIPTHWLYPNDSSADGLVSPPSNKASTSMKKVKINDKNNKEDIKTETQNASKTMTVNQAVPNEESDKDSASGRIDEGSQDTDSPVWNPAPELQKVQDVIPEVSMRPPPDTYLHLARGSGLFPSFLKSGGLFATNQDGGGGILSSNSFLAKGITSGSVLFGGINQPTSSAVSNASRGNFIGYLKSLKVMAPYLRDLERRLMTTIKEASTQCGRMCEVLLLAKYLPADAFSDSIKTPGSAETVNFLPTRTNDSERDQENKRSAPERGFLTASNTTKKVKTESNDSTNMDDAPGPLPIVDRDGARSYRLCPFVTEAVAIQWSEDPAIFPAKYLIKQRILSEMDVGIDANRQVTREEAIEHRGSAHKSLDSRAKSDLHKEWLKTLYSYLRTLLKLRRAFPMDTV